MQRMKQNVGSLVVVGILGFLLGRTGTVPTAKGSVAGGANGDVIAFASESAQGGGQVLYLIDPKTQVFSVYDVDPRKPKVRLAGVRHYQADHQLAEFNNDPPFVADIEKMLRSR